MSQSFNNGNPDFCWKRGAALTAPLEGLWKLASPVTQEDVNHMKSRVLVFEALVGLSGPMRTVPHCAESWCKWVVQASVAYASRHVPVPVPGPVIDDEDL